MSYRQLINPCSNMLNHKGLVKEHLRQVLSKPHC